jgi:hypothetical protein
LRGKTRPGLSIANLSLPEQKLILEMSRPVRLDISKPHGIAGLSL